MPPKRIKFVVKKKKEEPTKPKKKIKFVVKKKEMPKKKIKFVVKPKTIELATELMGQFGLSNEEANAMKPEELFGLLSTELKLIILDPKTTGVKVATTPSLPLDLAKSLDTIAEDAHNNRGFSDYVNGWSYYEGGNWNDATTKYWEKKSKQLDDANFDDLISDLFENPDMQKVVSATIKKHNLSGYYGIQSLVDDRGIYNDEWKYNEDWTDYYPQDTYDLIYDDGDYYMSNTTKSTTNSLIKESVIRIKKEKIEAKKVIKEIQKFLKENKI